MLTLGACGRLDFERGPMRNDARPADAPPDLMLDAPLGPGCNAFTTVTPQDCQAALADPANASDAVVYACAASCAWKQCYVVDRADCMSCACDNYVKSLLLCDAAGLCSAPINGTGCISGGNPAVSCPATGDDISEAACILRALLAMGHC